MPVAAAGSPTATSPVTAQPAGCGQPPRRVDVALSRKQFSAFGIGLDGERRRADAPADRRCFGEFATASAQSCRAAAHCPGATPRGRGNSQSRLRSRCGGRGSGSAVPGSNPHPHLRRRLPRSAHPWLVPTGRSMAGWSIAGEAPLAGTTHAQAQSRRCRPARTPARRANSSATPPSTSVSGTFRDISVWPMW